MGHDPWLLNTPGGIVDLRTGTILPHDPDRYIKMTAVAPGGSLPALDDVLGTSPPAMSSYSNI